MPASEEVELFPVFRVETDSVKGFILRKDTQVALLRIRRRSVIIWFKEVGRTQLRAGSLGQGCVCVPAELE